MPGCLKVCWQCRLQQVANREGYSIMASGTPQSTSIRLVMHPGWGKCHPRRWASCLFVTGFHACQHTLLPGVVALHDLWRCTSCACACVQDPAHHTTAAGPPALSAKSAAPQQVWIFRIAHASCSHFDEEPACLVAAACELICLVQF